MDSKVTLEPLPKKTEKKPTTRKPRKTDDEKNAEFNTKFEYNNENIEYLTKGLDHKKIFIKKSPFTDEQKIICLMIKHNFIKDYKCSISTCKVKNNWNNKPIQLFLSRKNNQDNDLSPDNLELICPNCYMQIYGLELFKKKLDFACKYCTHCKYPLSKFHISRLKTQICVSCERKIIEKKDLESKELYLSNLQKLTNSKEADEAITKTNYFKEVSKFKKIIPDKTNTSTKNKNYNDNDPIIIECNMNITNIDDLLNNNEEIQNQDDDAPNSHVEILDF